MVSFELLDLVTVCFFFNPAGFVFANVSLLVFRCLEWARVGVLRVRISLPERAHPVHRQPVHRLAQ